MKRLFLVLLLAAQGAFAVDIFNVPVQFTTGSSITIQSGVPMLGTWDFTGATMLGVPAGATTLTGNVTGSGTGTFATTVVTIPDLVSAPGSIIGTKVAPPVAPSAGFIKYYSDSTDSRFHDKNDAGTTGTTVVAATAPANQFSTGLGTNGVQTFAQPTFPNITGAMPLSQLATQALNTVVGNATGGTAVPTAVAPATARSSSLLNIDQKTTIGDAAYTILPTDRTVVTSVLFTAARTWILPAANSVNPGQHLDVVDSFGAANGIAQLTVSRAGADTIEPGALTTLFTQTGGPKQSFTFVSDGVSKWYVSAFNPGTIPGSGRVIQSSVNTWQPSVPVWPIVVGTLDYSVTSDGSTGYRAYPTGLCASSVSNVVGGYAADTYVAGSAVTVAAGDFKAQGQYHCVFDMQKTSAGTAAPIITVRMGTAGTTADTAICILTFSAGTAVADNGTFEVWFTFRTVGSGTSAAAESISTCVHQGGVTGLVSKTSDYANSANGGFASNTQTKIGVSFNGGASFSGTNTLVQATLTQP
jgi:hypothetical protein